jgi:DOPA 4,5-dioxygenase
MSNAIAVHAVEDLEKWLGKRDAPVTQAADIRGVHAHVYFDAVTRSTAERIRDALARHLGLEVGVLHERPVGPHAKAMFQVTITPEQFGTVVPWLMVNRAGLSVLVHPITDDTVGDHDTRPLWMGQALSIDVESLGPRDSRSRD